MGEASLRRRVAERMGYKVVRVPDEPWPHYDVINPQGEVVCSRRIEEMEDAELSSFPPFDTWEGVGLVLKWLSKEVDFKIDVSGDEQPWHISRDTGSFFTSILMTATTDDLPTAICKFLLEVSE